MSSYFRPNMNVHWGQELQLSQKIKPLNYQTIVPNVLLSSKLINYIDFIKYCYSLLGASSYDEIFNLHTTIVDKNLENCEQPTCQKVVIELANIFYAAINASKTDYIVDRK
ncbi:unnamed protein product [Rotaria socialis]|uniref:Uncharacterized protein n=1 Tax=Rotaria socialis TaxID=392032 RepID=A0A820F2T8_9BILA|nr:unnamed protein product [Rotaria socialis]CAF4255261.1 unnamed protein product [Rotaria socialis]CAF4284403.1 unnamed protein product [Rotaria socialis]CAF4632274.1 unnamed protein product [Rotaria socialis]